MKPGQHDVPVHVLDQVAAQLRDEPIEEARAYIDGVTLAYRQICELLETIVPTCGGAQQVVDHVAGFAILAHNNHVAAAKAAGIVRPEQ